MAFNTGLQLSIELTKVFGTIRQVVFATQSVIQYARQLRASGSDIVVEEDLADVFGRAHIEQGVERDFRKCIKDGTTITPLHERSEIQLCAGAGPTVHRALRDSDHRYLSTTIQLSLLCWTHERTELASTISDCLSRRVEMNIAGANSGPGFEGILATLDACASQTSVYAWNVHYEKVRTALWEAYPRVQYPTLYTSDAWNSLSPDLLLSAMDCLCLVQTLPEDRIILVSTRRGMATLIVWAHCVLGLSVIVDHRGKQHHFGNRPPQVIIKPHEEEPLDQTMTSTMLLDKSMQVVIAYCPGLVEASLLGQNERHSLLGIGTEMLRREFNRYFVTSNDDAIYYETAETITAIAIIKSQTISRFGSGVSSFGVPCVTCLETWRVYDAASIIFSGMTLDRTRIEEAIALMLTTSTPTKLALSLLHFQRSANDFVTKMTAVRAEANSLKYWDRWSTTVFEENLTCLATLVLLLAHVNEPEKCSTLPISLDFRPYFKKTFPYLAIRHGSASLPLEESSIFYHWARLLSGPIASVDAWDDCFLISDYGWSVHLSCCEDSDPSAVRPELINIRHGVPTNPKNGERKKFMVDPPRLRSSSIPPRTYNSRQPYIPSCQMLVSARDEFFSSRVGEFILGIRFSFDAVFSYPTNQKTTCYEITSYRKLHRALWRVRSTDNHTQCEHDRTWVNPNRITVAGYHGWAIDKIPDGGMDRPERVCIALVAGDPRARWLALNCIDMFPDRQFMLQSPDCCEECALDSLADLPGKWVLVS